jgi:hypothetical protein
MSVNITFYMKLDKEDGKNNVRNVICKVAIIKYFDGLGL